MTNQRHLTQEQKNRRAARARERYKENEEYRLRRKKSSVAWHDKNPGYIKDWQKANPDKVKGYNLKKNHNMSIEEYRERQKSQDDRCAVCFQQVGDELEVDHCHTYKHTRGLLCHICNKVLGLFLDSPDRFRSAAAYLERTAAPPLTSWKS